VDASSPSGDALASLGRQATASTLWLGAQKWGVRVTGLVTIALLARNVSPAEFGVVAAASAITPFILLLSDFGLSTYVVQAENPDARTIHTAFWLNAAIGVVLSAGMAIGAPLVADALHVPAAAAPVRALSVSALLAVLAALPIALLKRRMAFRLIALQGAAGAFVGQVVAIVLALRGAGAWALVAQLIVAQAVITVMSWISARWRPAPEFDRHRAPGMLRFGLSVVSIEFIATARATAETAVVAAALGAGALGYLNVAQRLVLVVQDLGASAVVPVSTVVFAKVRDSMDRLRTAYLRALRLAYVAVAPLLVLVAVGAPLLVPVLFGPQWSQSVPVTRGYAVAAILTLGAMIDQGLFYGVGAPGTWFWYAAVVDILTVATTALLAPHGLLAVAVGFVVVALLATIARWVLVGRLLRTPAREVARPFAATVLLACVAGVAGLLALLATSAVPRLVGLAVVALAIAVAHLLATRAISPAVLQDAVGLAPVPARIARPLARLAGSRATESSEV
jgi:O-antigen/teichoic acid export membrane protein